MRLRKVRNQSTTEKGHVPTVKILFSWQDVELPTDMDLHHVIKLDNTTFIIVGGYPHDGFVFLLDWSTKQFRQLNSTLVLRHASFSGIVNRQDNGKRGQLPLMLLMSITEWI